MLVFFKIIIMLGVDIIGLFGLHGLGMQLTVDETFK
jgi:hypothetical protein